MPADTTARRDLPRRVADPGRPNAPLDVPGSLVLRQRGTTAGVVGTWMAIAFPRSLRGRREPCGPGSSGCDHFGRALGES